MDDRIVLARFSRPIFLFVFCSVGYICTRFVRGVRRARGINKRFFTEMFEVRFPLFYIRARFLSAQKLDRVDETQFWGGATAIPRGPLAVGSVERRTTENAGDEVYTTAPAHQHAIFTEVPLSLSAALGLTRRCPFKDGAPCSPVSQ